MTKEEIEGVWDEFVKWLDDDETWDNDLDGYSGRDLAESAARQFKNMLIGDPK